MMILWANFPLFVSISFVVFANSALAEGERWSRQVTNSEWIPLANPRNQQGHNQNLVPSILPQIHQPLIPGSLPPELRQEYQQQLLQLQKTQESIQRLLLLQQQLKAQQQLLQGQASLPNGMADNDDNKQAQQSALVNSRPFQELNPEDLVPPQLSGQPRPPLYTSQNFRQPQGEIRQEQYEDYTDHQVEDYRNSERTRENFREKDRYEAESPTGQGNDGETGDDGEEEVQVVYVPAETLAQRGQAKNQQRGRDRKQFGNQEVYHQQRPYSNQQSPVEEANRQGDNVPKTVSPEDDAYARDFLQQLQREHEGTDRLLKEAREKELERLREERKEIQRRAKLQQAAVQREQEIQRQREAEKRRKELAKLEEVAKQRELERIRESRERQRLEEIERSKKAEARANEEKKKQEEARQAEIERLAVLERQKKAEIERTIAAQKDLERIQKEEEERRREAERNHLARQKEATKIRQDDTETSPHAQPLTRNQHHHQQLLGQSGKYNRHGRIRTKPRQRQHSQNVDNTERIIQETTTTMIPPSPNQPPLAVYMSTLVGEKRAIRITDVLKILKEAKTIDVLDNVGQNAPRVFVGPSNLEVPESYAKFDLPYLSSIDNNRVERRVDKLPFFVAPLSFNPPPGYSKIPFPAPHIGSVVVNNLDSNVPFAQPDGNLEEIKGPLVEPNSFSDDSSQGVSFSPNYDSSTTPTYTSSRHEEPSSSTPQYQSSAAYSNVEGNDPGSSYNYQNSFNGEPASGLRSQEQSQLTYHGQLELRPTYQEESSLPVAHSVATQYNDDSIKSTTPVYRQPNVVTSFAYEENQKQVSSSTPTYQPSYSNVRDDSSNQPTNAPTSPRDRDSSQNRQVVNRYQSTDQRKNERGEQYVPNAQIDSGLNQYENSPTGPTQYNLPAELPPIHPQLPGLVNSLLDEGEQSTLVTKQPTLPTTTSTTTTRKITTTETPKTTQRSRGRHRGRVVATRPSTTTTTTPSPSSKSRDTDRTRRPFGRTRTRYTTTTEEYKETYEPTKTKATVTTPRYNSQDNYKRPVTTKTQKYKNRESERTLHSSRNHVHNVQSQEAANDRKPSLISNSRQVETAALDSKEPVYGQYDFASATTSRENYPILYNDEERIANTPGEIEYAKMLKPSQESPSASSNLGDQADWNSQQFEERYPTSDYSQTGLEAAPVNGFNYQIRDEQSTTTPNVPTPSRKFPYYQNKQENFENVPPSGLAANKPNKAQSNDYQRPLLYDDSDLTRPQSYFPVNQDKTSGVGASDDGFYNPYSPDTGDGLRVTGLLPEQAPFELTTEVPATTTTTTEAAPLIIRQRVRARLGGRGRPDSLVQTRPRGSQDEYVRFSAVNNQNAPTTERPASRHRENHRAKPKARQQQQGVQIQTEGDDYVRIQAPIRTYQKTIVTPPSTTQRPTTTPTPTTRTTTIDYETSNDELEYGFIRPPNFAPVHPVENRYQNVYRPDDNQAQLQSILPTDETAADSIPSHTQVPRNRPKHQSINRRPTGKTIPSTTVSLDSSPFTERPRHRVEEPRNNRIRVRGRKPGKKRTTTTTTTTTEYIIEENNDLPLEENYPRPIQSSDDVGRDRQVYYDEKFEALPLASGASSNPIQPEHGENSFSSQDFLLNFGSDADQPSNVELDQTQLASQPLKKYGKTGGTRTRTDLSYQGSQDRDIYGSESQWSTKLSSTSFQPSPSANSLTQNDQKMSGISDDDKNLYSKSEVTADTPEVITAPPEDSYVTMLVTSDNLPGKSTISESDTSLDASPMEGTNFGMKTSLESRYKLEEKTTPTSIAQDTIMLNSTRILNNDSDKKSVQDNQSSRRTGGRRRRVRVRVRPAASDDFVTAESQHFNSAVNSLIQDQLRYNRRGKESRKTTTTTESSTLHESRRTHLPEQYLHEDFNKEIFKKENKSKVESEVHAFVKSESATSDFGTSTLVDDISKIVSNQSETNSNGTNAATDPSDIVKNDSDGLTNATNDVSSINESETTANDLTTTERMTTFSEENSSTVNFPNNDEFSTDTPLMTTMTIPKKSWDSTKPYKELTALSNGEYYPFSNQNTESTRLDEDTSGQGNEVSGKEYRQETARNEDNSLSENNETENYPKNHRSEWSEVRYPTNPELYHYSRHLNLSTTRLPGIVTKTDDDTSVKTLSDYVKAIFDTMKTAGDSKNESTTVFNSEAMSSEDERVPTTTHDSSRRNESLEDILSTIASGFDDSTTTFDASEYSSEKSDASVREVESEGKTEDQTETVPSTENSIPNENKEFTEQPSSTEIIDTPKQIDETMEVSTEINSIDFTSLPSKSPFFDTSTNIKTVNPMQVKIGDSVVSTTEQLPLEKNSTETKLGGILRTSTTTKISHMTEICYRGRCVMTKPRKEIYER